MALEIMRDEIYETIPKEVLVFKFEESSPLSLKGVYPFWFHILILKGYVILDGFTHLIVKPNIDENIYLEFHDGDYIVSEGSGVDNVMVYTPNEFNKLFRKVN